MTYEDLLEQRIIEPVHIEDSEIAGLLRVARRDIKAAQGLITSSLDWAFAIAYNAILQLSIAYMNHLGYRPRGEAKHVNTFRFLERALPKEAQEMVDRLQKLRKKRNLTIYQQTGLVSEKEAHDVINFAEQYYKKIESMLPRNIVNLSRKED